MRVLFVLSGHIWRHTLPEGFRDAGHDTMVISSAVADQLPNTIAQYRPHMAVTIGWGKEQSSKNQLLLRRCFQSAKVPHIYWSVEDPEYTMEFSLPLIQKMQPDFIFTICRETAGYFQRLGFQAGYMDFGFSPQTHPALQREQRYDIAVVANAYPGILSKRPNHFRHQSLIVLVEPLLKQQTRVDFFGRGWAEMQGLYGWNIPQEWIHPPVDYQDTAEIYHTTGISLGLQNYAHQVTQRTYEILGSGGFMLTIDTPGVRTLFTPGEELACASSPGQTLELVRYYQLHPDERRRIAAQGHSRISLHTYRHRAEHMLDILKKAGIVAKG